MWYITVSTAVLHLANIQRLNFTVNVCVDGGGVGEAVMEREVDGSQTFFLVESNNVNLIQLL